MKNFNLNKRAFNLLEASEYIGVSRGTIYNWITSDQLPYEKLPGRGNGLHKFILIRKIDIDNFLEKHYQNSSLSIKNKEELQKNIFLLSK